jgi:delta(3,5)-delta(2,4)-dienoyl-CoA isomerase
MADKSPVAVQGTKHLLNHAVNHTIQEGLEYTAVWNGSMLQSDDVIKSIQAVRTKTSANFSKL